MKIKMELLSDTIFGNGMSVPGGEDISVLHDNQGFPYYKGGTFKGIFREEAERYFEWSGKDIKSLELLLGTNGDNIFGDKLVFSDFCIADDIKDRITAEVGDKPELVLDIFTNMRAFNAIESDDESTISKDGSLRSARCVDEGICFYSEIKCAKEDEETVKEILKMIKWIGNLRNRGFGKVKISVLEG